MRNVERSCLGRRKMIPDENLDLLKRMKRTIHGNSEKIYDLFFIIKFLKNILLFKQKLQ